MLPISSRQEGMWVVNGDEVTIQYKDESESPSKRPRLDSSGASNEVAMTSTLVSEKESETPYISTCENINITESASTSRLKSSLATKSEVKKWERDIIKAREKLQLSGRHDRFELMSPPMRFFMMQMKICLKRIHAQMRSWWLNVNYAMLWTLLLTKRKR